jgi:hypothetical protein
MAALTEAILECGHDFRGLAGRPAAEESDDWDSCLLRMRRNWPCRHRAAEKRDELAPLHVCPMAQDKVS